MKSRALLLILFFLVEAALLALAHWQWQRYHHKLARQEAQASLPPATLAIEAYQPTQAFLTQQPAPGSGRLGWRLIAVVHTSTTAVIVDRGWQPAQPIGQPTPMPDFSALTPPTSPTTLLGHWQPLPTRKGWLKGPDTTTHPQLLAFLNPARLTSATVRPDYFQLTQADATPTTLIFGPSAPPFPPQRHLAYAIQWLTMALTLPLLVFGAVWAKRRRRSA
jgi:cytochrome oxidase assembly protein ShyY1